MRIINMEDWAEMGVTVEQENNIKRALGIPLFPVAAARGGGAAPPADPGLGWQNQPISDWSFQDTVDWFVATFKWSSKYLDTFSRAMLDGASLMEVDDACLKDVLGIKLFAHRRRCSVEGDEGHADLRQDDER